MDALAVGRCPVRTLVFAAWAGVSLASAAALAATGPEDAQRNAQENIVSKVAPACGVTLAVSYDAASLRQHDKYIQGTADDGARQCNEPLRYLWYACKTDEGKAAVKAARIAKIVCKGVPGDTGSLAVAGGTISVARAFEEKEPHLRSRRQFEAAMKLALKPGADDPYHDEGWNRLAQEPNPVTSTTTYCLVNGGKVAFDGYAHDAFCRRKQDATVKCWKDGEVVIDLKIAQGRKTGFVTSDHTRGTQRTTYRDDKEHGERRTTENGKLQSIAQFENGKRIWLREFHPSGKLARFTRQLATGTVELAARDDGKVLTLRCAPTADDTELRKPCGFEGVATTSIYDGTGKVTRVETYKDGVIQKEAAGDSSYARGSNVAFKGGKKDGEERVLRADGTLASSTTWSRGVKDGKELTYSEDGKKVVKEIVWKADVIQQLTDFYLNGNPELKEIHDGPRKKQFKTFWDTGKVSGEGQVALCQPGTYGSRGNEWCEEGAWKRYFEDGTPREELTFRAGRRQGPRHTWWENGKPAAVEEYRDDRLTRAKRWDKDGKLLSDDEFEADGSRKLKR